jgi:hypothetical protein
MAKPAYYTVTKSLAGDGFEYHQGEVIEADDPAIRKWPDHFAPLVVRGQPHPVEQATAAPGEKRGA